MKVNYLTISPHDPIIARDGRPFGIGQGHRMRSLDWPYPSVLAGSLRTMLGMMRGDEFNSSIVEDLKKVALAGPLPVKDGWLYLPVPKDILVREEDSKALALRPSSMRTGEGCNIPLGEIQPTVLPNSIEEDFKPGKMPAFWSVDKMTEWLANPTGECFNLPEKGFFDSLEVPEKDERIHSKIDRETGVAEDTKLFSTVSLDLFSLGVKGGIGARIETEGAFENEIKQIDAFHTFGGERRLAHCKINDAPSGWDCPKKISDCLRKSNKVRMILASPAIFYGGWLPGWLHEKEGLIEGHPPNSPEDLDMKLVSACVDRWKPISGWSLEKTTSNQKPGPKAIRRLVSAGSVYFFEVTKGSAKDLAQLWLRPVSDGNQNRSDGFGLALWGIWDTPSEDEKK